MEKLSNPAVEFQERILLRKIVPVEKFLSCEGREKFSADSHLHSFTRAFGLPEERLCARCFEKPLVAEFTLPRVYYSGEKQSRIFLKLVGMLKEWRKYSLPLEIRINGREFFQGFVFFENVCRGWPSNYFYLPPQVLKEGKNRLEILNKSKGKKKENILFINRLEIIEKPPYEDLALIYVPSLVGKGEVFRVEVSVLKPYSRLRIEPGECFEWLGVKIRSLHPFSLEEENLGKIKEIKKEGRYSFLFRAKAEGVGKKIIIEFEGKKVNPRVELIYREEEAPPLWVGTDSDDHRHDESGEMEKILDRFYSTEMGNYLVFRPKQGRNFIKPAGKKRWKRWIAFCEERKICFRITTWPLPGDPFPVEFLKKKKFFQGIHFHEAYLAFQRIQNPWLNPETGEEVFEIEPIKKARTLKELESAYRAYLLKLRRKYAPWGFPLAWGEPSLLGVYLPLQKGDVVQAEPVSNISLLFGAIRGISRARGNLLWGAHIPIDWYLGFPHDEAASRRFRLLLNLVYTHGGNYAYAENALFKTNAYERWDEEDLFCRKNREIIRDFYRYLRLHPRRGNLKVNLAVLYGRFEHVLWLPDDRIPEVKDTNHWDMAFWGRWKEAPHRWAWRAVDGWLPPLPLKEFRPNPSLLKLFCGSPFGQVDILPPDSSPEVLSRYRCLALLGWNTMDEELYQRLKEWVKGGGVLYLFASHFDTRLKPEGEIKPFRRGKVEDLVGVELLGPGEGIKKIRLEESIGEAWKGKKEYFLQGKVRVSYLRNLSAKILARGSEGEPILLEKRLGKGKVYLGNFWDHPYESSLIEFNREVLEFLGSLLKGKFGIEETKLVNYTLWEDAQEFGGRMTLVNINWKEPGNREKFSLRLWGKLYPVDCREGFIREVVWKDSIALSLEERDIGIVSLKKREEKLYTAELKGVGEGKILGFLKEGGRVEIRDGEGRLLRAQKEKEDTFSLLVKVKGWLFLQLRRF